jgi:desulfoferrodoxin (superoxide reductase-like protein)
MAAEYVMKLKTKTGQTFTSVPIDTQDKPANDMAEAVARRCDGAAFYLPVKQGEFVIVPMANVHHIDWVPA